MGLTLLIVVWLGLGGATNYQVPFATEALCRAAREAVFKVRVPVDRDHGFRWKVITQSGGT